MESLAPKTINVEDLTSDEYPVQQTMYPRKLYGIILSYSEHPMERNRLKFMHLYVTDFTSSPDLFKFQTYESRFPLGPRSAIDSDQILTIEMDTNKFIRQLRPELQKFVDCPDPSARPFDELFPHWILVEVEGKAKRYNETIEFQRCTVKVLTTGFIHNEYKRGKNMHLINFIKRLKGFASQSTGLEILSHRYGLSDLDRFDEIRRAKEEEEDQPASLYKFHEFPPEVNRDVPPISAESSRILDGMRDMPDVPQYDSNDSDDDDSLQIQYGPTSSRQISTSAGDPMSESAFMRPQTFKTTKIDRLICDPTLKGAFMLDNVKIIGYLPHHKPLIYVATNGQYELTDEFAILVADSRSKSMYTQYLRVEFPDFLAALKFFNLDISSITIERELKRKLNSLVTNGTRSLKLRRVPVPGLIGDIDIWTFNDPSIEYLL